MADRILITGGAGFVGSHLADELLRQGYRVRVLDNLSSQVHGAGGARPEYLANDVEFIEGDVRNPAIVRRALAGTDSVYHLAAAVGVGQSMYAIADYTSLNNIGTAVLLEAIIERREQIKRLVVASSMSIYGEGLYRDASGQIAAGIERTPEQLKRHDWEVRDTRNQALSPVPTPETKTPALASVYALSKFDQERMSLMVGQAYGVPTIALRFFNIYGPRQALSNPYTGVLAIFASRLLNDRSPLIFEDGLQRRDFVSVHDVVTACRLAMEASGVQGQVLNIGSGTSYTIRQISERIAAAMQKPYIEAEISGKYRVGDIRHCFADITRAREALGYEPQVSLDSGLRELAEWLEGQEATDQFDAARAELDRRGLSI